jgi:hypothetical protein
MYVTTQLCLISLPGTVDLYLYSLIHLHGRMFNYLITGTMLPLREADTTEEHRMLASITNFILNAVFCDVTLCGSLKNRCFGGTITPIIRVTRIGDLGKLAVNSIRSTLRTNIMS